MTDKQEIPFTLHDYMLKEFELSVEHTRHVDTLTNVAEQFYLTMTTAVIGGALALLSNLRGVPAIFIVGIAFLLIAILGTRLVLRTQFLFQVEMVIRIQRAGFKRFFRQLDPKSFERFGIQMSLDELEFPYHWLRFSRAPWKRVRLVGYFALVHSAMFGIGLGLLTASVLEWVMSLFVFWVYLAICILIAEMAFHVHLYLIFKDAEKKHRNAKKFYEKMLDVYKDDFESQDSVCASSEGM